MTPTTPVVPEERKQSTPLAVRVSEAARLLDIGRSKCYDLIRSGTLPSIRVGKTVRVPLAPLYAWVEQQSADKKEASSG
jgi:excisionase family DNA binding protein